MLIKEFLEESAQKFPQKIALIAGNSAWRYEQLNRAANVLARQLVDNRFNPGDRAVLLTENSIEMVIAIFAVLKVGGAFVPLHSSTKTNQLIYLINNCQAKVLFVSTASSSDLQDVRLKAPMLEKIWLMGAAKDITLSLSTQSRPSTEVAGTDKVDGFLCLRNPEVGIESVFREREETKPISPAPAGIPPADLATLIYTSGSTGHPKGVTLTNHNWVTAIKGIVRYLENTHEDVILNALPLSSSYGLTQIFTAFYVGATVLLEKAFTAPYAILNRAAQQGVTGFAGVPTMFALLQKLDRPSFSFPTLRYVTNAGAALPVPFIAKLQQWFPNARIYLMYGLTECIRVSYLPPEEIARRPTSVGKPMPGIQAFVVDEEGNSLPPHHIGELVVRGENVTPMYWGEPQRSAQFIRSGATQQERILHTNDLFKVDEEGFLYWVARRDELIKVKGFLISPYEIENVLYQLAGIAEVKVVGLPDKTSGEIIKALIVLEPEATLTPRQITEHVSRYLEDYKVPQMIEFVPTLSKTHTGKIIISKGSKTV